MRVGLNQVRVARRAAKRRGQILRRERIDAARDRVGEHEQLEARARLALPLDGEVELVPGLARDDGRHRPDGARGRVDCDERRRRVAGPVERGADRRLRMLLRTPVERRADREPALANGRGAVAGDEPLVHVVDEEGLGLLCGRRARLQPEGRGGRAPVRRLVDVTRGQQGLQDLPPPLLCGRRVAQRVVIGRRLRQAGEQRRLRERELRRRPGEVRLRCGLHAVRLLAVEHGVQVGVEHLRLRPPVRELVGEAALLELSPDRPLAAEVEVAHELLRQRRAALCDARGRHVGDGGTQHCDPVRAALLVEAPVLDRDGRLRELRIDPVQGNGLVHDGRAERCEPGPVGRVQRRAPADAVRLQPAEIASDEEVRAAAMDLQGDGSDERGQEHRRREQPPAPRRPVGQRSAKVAHGARTRIGPPGSGPARK